MTTLLQDVRYALRQLRAAPGFSLVAILTLALGIGATTAIFTLVYQVMLRSIPVEHPEQLYKLGKSNDCCVTSGVQGDWSLYSYELYKYLRDQTRGVEGVAAVDSAADPVSVRRAGDRGNAQPLTVRFVSGNYFPLLGVTPFAGRMLTPDDDRDGAAPVAVLSYTLWQTRFAAEPSLVGQTLLLTGHPVTVVGIAAPAFLGERTQADAPGIWLPLSLEPTLFPDRPLMKFPASHWLDILVRIKHPADAPAVQSALIGELRQWVFAHPEDFAPNGITAKQIAQQTLELASASGGINTIRDSYEQSLQLLQLVTAFVLLIACANLANLMLVRGMGRRQQLAVRSALGAPQSRLIRQMLVEAILIALTGGAIAIAIAYLGTHAMLALAFPGAQINPLAASPSLPVLGFALALSLTTGVLFGIAPAFIASRANPVEALRGANRSTNDASARPQKVLVILQAALSLAVLSTAGLLITSLHRLEKQDFHFDSSGRLVVFTDLTAAGYSYPQLANLYRQIDDRFSQLPGVVHFAYGTYSPMVSNRWATNVYFPDSSPNDNNNADYDSVSSQYFPAVGTRLLSGRLLDEHDTATAVHTAVVNRTFADKFLKGKEPLGEHFGPDPKLGSEFEIVGIVDDTKYGDPADKPRPMFFTPITQATSYTEQRDISNENAKHFANNLVVEYRGDSAAMQNQVRETLKSINPDIPILQMLSYRDQVASQFTQQDLVVRLTTIFGLLALVLAALGLYGVTAYNVAHRTSEIGVRMALGASRANVLGMIVRGAVLQVAIGLAIGLPLSFAAGRMIQSTLYDTPSFQPLVLLAVIALLGVATLVAAALPARRAASIEPMQALRTQ